MESCTPYATDISDEEWGFVAPHLALVRADVPRRRHDLRCRVKTGVLWRILLANFPPWEAVYQQTRRWLACDYELLLATVARLHFLAFACLQLHRLVPLLAESSWQALVRVEGAHERSGMAADASRCRRSRVCRARRL